MSELSSHELLFVCERISLSLLEGTLIRTLVYRWNIDTTIDYKKIAHLRRKSSKGQLSPGHHCYVDSMKRNARFLNGYAKSPSKSNSANDLAAAGGTTAGAGVAISKLGCGGC